MGTRSNIIVQSTKTGQFVRVYCHWNGYPSHHGPILLGHYNRQHLAEELVFHGDMSSLAENCTKPRGHSFEHPKKGYTVYYGRDRNDRNRGPDVCDSLIEAFHEAGDDIEYFYVWKDGQWLFCPDLPKAWEQLIPLKDAVARSVGTV
jgi:hypothetical protein